MDALKPPETVSIDHLLANNDPPHDRRKLQRILQEIKEKEAALDALSNELSTRRAEYASYGEVLPNVLAPCRMVPADIWSTVFGFIPDCCWEISWVCQGWRNIALSMPSLWTEIPEIGGTKRSPEAFLSQLRARCIRSGSHPLTITDLRLPLALGLEPDDLEEFVTLFNAMVPRVESMNVHVGGEQWTTAAFSFLTMFTQHFDQLANVHLYMHDDRHPDVVFEETKLFQLSPKLRYMALDIRTERSVSLTTWLSIPWVNLVNLEIGWVSLQDFYFVMESSPTLERLLAFVDDDALGADQGQPPTIRDPIRHSYLRELVWGFANEFDYLDVLSIVDLPKIESVVLETTAGDWDYQSFLESPEAFPTRPFLHLTHLYVGPNQARYYDSRLMVGFLKLTPLIQRLWIVWDKHMELLFDELSTTGEGGSFLLPSLTLLHITKTPAFFLKESQRGEWHVAISCLAKKRSSFHDDGDDDSGARRSFLIALSSERREWSEELRIDTRGGVHICLNQTVEQIDEGLELQDDYFSLLRNLIEEIQTSPSSAVDDLVCRTFFSFVSTP